MNDQSPTQIEQNADSQQQDEEKKSFVKPEVRRKESLPEVTGFTF